MGCQLSHCGILLLTLTFCANKDTLWRKTPFAPQPVPKLLPVELTQQILAEVARHPEGIGVEPLAKALADRLSRRTLQRRLIHLVVDGRLIAAGATKARIYKLAPGVNVASEAPEPELPPTQQLTLSREASDLAELVRRPLQARKPVGYNRAFLESY